MSLVVKNVSKSFNQSLVLEQCNFKIEKSRIVGLVGDNGAGKTTLLKCIQGVYSFEGSITLDDKEIYENNEIKSKIFMISDSIWFPLNATMKSMKDLYSAFYTFNNTRFQKYVELFKLDENKKLSTFSKGMNRMAMVCFAFAIEPELLLIDEVFDGLSPTVRQIFKKTIIQDMEEMDMSVLVSSHALRELEDICDDFIFLNKTVYTQGNIQELKQMYSKLQIVCDDLDELYENIGKDKIVQSKTTGKVTVITCKLNKEEIHGIMKKINPAFYECLPITFEEYYLLVETEEERDE